MYSKLPATGVLPSLHSSPAQTGTKRALATNCLTQGSPSRLKVPITPALELLAWWLKGTRSRLVDGDLILVVDPTERRVCLPVSKPGSFCPEHVSSQRDHILSMSPETERTKRTLTRASQASTTLKTHAPFDKPPSTHVSRAALVP